MNPRFGSAFAERHIGPSSTDQDRMLATIGVASAAELVEAAIPAGIRSSSMPGVPQARTESEVQARLRSLSERNVVTVPMYGLGYSQTVTPPVIRRGVLENPAWYTAYTPYQPEISQGRLEALLTFQTMCSDLTGLATSGASLLDEGTAVAEAVALAKRAAKKGTRCLVDPGLYPQSLAVLRTRAEALGLEVVIGAPALDDALDDVFCVVVQQPTSDGLVRAEGDLRRIAETAHEAGALVVAACDLLSLTLLASPASWGADVAVGSTQRFGVPLFFGGPHAGNISVREGLERQLPGRLVGVSVDADGVPAYRLALQTREQHIRREKATSNICTSQVLLAVTAALYAVYHGPAGLRRIASEVHAGAQRIAATAVAAGLDVRHDTYFDTVVIEAPGRAAELVAAAHDAGILLRGLDDDAVAVSVGEGVTEAELGALAAVLGAPLADVPDTVALGGHDRPDDYLTHPVFSSYRSETEMMRYLRAMADRDFALDRGMIPLGSCTMKLNPAAALEPISYPGFAALHPFAPASDSQGYAELITELESWLCAITGYDKISLQPNAGSQGEFSGLLAIKRYHESRGESHRTVCLIPSSAHGTNAASAALAGLSVVVVKAAPDGSVDLADLHAKIEANADKLAAIMVTYPSTHGVFEDTITSICESVHAAGGQVYVDGANLNALVGLARPGAFGADVSHLNLHKTFAIPHGGGGPGVGPVAVREHLAQFLPGDPLGEGTTHAVASAPQGSAGVLPITYAYIALMGPAGLRAATEAALIAANYVAKRLSDTYPVLYAGESGLVAHECILDLRALTKRTGVTVDDVAKRLVDYGFHAPTMSFPVAGTLMVEPTESESKEELDRFCDAMIAIAGEAERVLAGEWPIDDNPLHNAPHPLARVVADEWDHPYSRQLAAFPGGTPHGPLAARPVKDKYWPAVGRIDGVYGDRNLMCECPPPEAYES
ncbi:MAG: aminomethyl-transferring glycine dehydrogenase [Actinobacteria bacterium]|nr:aminomethyl-transferring glycine dehydrogenase [Actinomycetota bacterium]